MISRGDIVRHVDENKYYRVQAFHLAVGTHEYDAVVEPLEEAWIKSKSVPTTKLAELTSEDHEILAGLRPQEPGRGGDHWLGAVRCIEHFRASPSLRF